MPVSPSEEQLKEVQVSRKAAPRTRHHQEADYSEALRTEEQASPLEELLMAVPVSPSEELLMAVPVSPSEELLMAVPDWETVLPLHPMASKDRRRLRLPVRSSCRHPEEASLR